MQSTIDVLDDEDLVERLRSDDPGAFASLYDRHVARVYSYCARQLGTTQDADDLTAVVFLEAWRHRSGIRIVSGTALPWLLMTATNVARNHRRASRRYRAALRRIPPPDPSPDHAPDVVADHDFAQTGKILAAALAQLHPLDRQVVSLCLIEGFTYGEAAEVLGLTHSAVRSRLMRTRREVKSALIAAGITSAELGADEWGDEDD